MKTNDASSILPKIRRIGEGLTCKSVENLKSKIKESLTPILPSQSRKPKLTSNVRDWKVIKCKDSSSASPLLKMLTESLNKKLKYSKIFTRNPIHIIGQKFVESNFNITKLIIQKPEEKKISLKSKKVKKKIISDKKLVNPQKSCQSLLKPINVNTNIIDSNSSGVSISAWD
jgi:hypothetical protein